MADTETNTRSPSQISLYPAHSGSHISPVELISMEEGQKQLEQKMVFLEKHNLYRACEDLQSIKPNKPRVQDSVLVTFHILFHVAGIAPFVLMTSKRKCYCYTVMTKIVLQHRLGRLRNGLSGKQQ